jgi:hypothetical protein
VCNTLSVDIVICLSVARERLANHVPEKKIFWSSIGKMFSIVKQGAVNKFRQQLRPCSHMVRAETISDAVKTVRDELGGGQAYDRSSD